MDLFPPRPRLRLTRRQAIVGLLALVAANLAAAAIAAYDAEQRRRAEVIPAAPPALAPGPSLVAGRPLRNDAGRAVVVFAVCNTIVLGALGFAVLARYLEALRRYNLGLPAGFDESRLRRRHRRAPGLEGARFRDDPGSSPHRRFDWPD